MTYHHVVIETARAEYAKDGVVSTDTYARLTAEGMDADAIITRIVEEKL